MTLALPMLDVLAGFRTSQTSRGLLSQAEMAAVHNSRLARVWVDSLLQGGCSPEYAARIAWEIAFPTYDYLRREACRVGLEKVIRAIVSATGARWVRPGVWILDLAPGRKNALVFDIHNPTAPAVRAPQRGDRVEWFSVMVAIERYWTPRPVSDQRPHPNEGAYRVIALQADGSHWPLTRSTRLTQALNWAECIGQERGLPYQTA